MTQFTIINAKPFLFYTFLITINLIKILLLLLVLPIPAFAETGLGVSGYFDDAIKTGKEFVETNLGGCSIEGIGTNEECMKLAEAGFDSLQKTKDLAFSFHGLGESLVQFISPIQLGGFLLAVVSAVMGLVFFIKVGGEFGKHAAYLMLVLFGIGLALMVFGNKVTI